MVVWIKNHPFACNKTTRLLTFGTYLLTLPTFCALIQSSKQTKVQTMVIVLLSYLLIAFAATFASYVVYDSFKTEGIAIGSATTVFAILTTSILAFLLLYTTQLALEAIA